jgi:hypothetical protein
MIGTIARIGSERTRAQGIVYRVIVLNVNPTILIAQYFHVKGTILLHDNIPTT